MLRTILWFISFWIYQFCIIPILLYVKILARQNRTAEVYSISQNTASRWARFLVWFSGTRVKVTGQEHIPVSGAVLFVSNHQGNFDIPILLGYIGHPKGFIAKIELRKVPFIGQWMEFLKCVFIERENTRKSLKAIIEGVEILKQGYSLVIFPEGTRSNSNTMGEFKSGGLKLATRSGAPVVPVTIKGSYKIMGKEGYLIKPGITVEVIISPPVDSRGKDATILAQEVQEVIAGKL